METSEMSRQPSPVSCLHIIPFNFFPLFGLLEFLNQNWGQKQSNIIQYVLNKFTLGACRMENTAFPSELLISPGTKGTEVSCHNTTAGWVTSSANRVRTLEP